MLIYQLFQLDSQFDFHPLLMELKQEKYLKKFFNKIHLITLKFKCVMLEQLSVGYHQSMMNFYQKQSKNHQIYFTMLNH